MSLPVSLHFSGLVTIGTAAVKTINRKPLQVLYLVFESDGGVWVGVSGGGGRGGIQKFLLGSDYFIFIPVSFLKNTFTRI